MHTVPSKSNRPPLSPMLTHSCLLSNRGTLYFEIADEPDNTDVCKRMAMYKFVLFEIQPGATMLNTY